MKKHVTPPSVVSAVILPFEGSRAAQPTVNPPCPKNVSMKFWRSVCDLMRSMIVKRSFREVFIDYARKIGANISKKARGVIEVVIYRHRKIAGKLKSEASKFKFSLNDGAVQPI